MNITEYLKKQGENDRITFIIEKAVKDESLPCFRNEYLTTPIRTAWEWAEWFDANKYIVINADHPPIDVTGTWGNWYKSGHLKCCVVTTEAEIIKQYGEMQGKMMIKHYKEKVK